MQSSLVLSLVIVGIVVFFVIMFFAWFPILPGMQKIGGTAGSRLRRHLLHIRTEIVWRVDEARRELEYSLPWESLLPAVLREHDHL